ncbi:MAG: carboxypeptidase-like regulatory domain-containing protein [Bacteroidota bacterium]
MIQLASQNRYPEFIPNQILTNAQLNQLHQYLDQQNRLSRTQLSGIGIVCGLTVQVVPGEIEGQHELLVSTGYGVTSDGYLIALPQAFESGAYNLPGITDPLVDNDTLEASPDLASVRLTHYRYYQDPDRVETLGGISEQPAYEPWILPNGDPIPTNPFPNQIELIELISEYQMDDDFEPLEDNPVLPISSAILTSRVLVLYLEKYPRDLKSCLTTDCTKNGLDNILTVRALLVPQAYVTANGDCGPDLSFIEIPRFFHGLRKTANISIPELSSGTQIREAYRDMSAHIQEQLLSQLPTTFAACASFLPISDLRGIMDDLALRVADLGGSVPVTQYHFDYYRDLAEAYNEFIRLNCELIKDCCQEDTYPRHVNLGVVDTSSFDANHPYRSLFTPAATDDHNRKELERAERMMRRLVSMLTQYELAEYSTEIKITPSMSLLHSLENRAIPFYYDYSRVAPWWNESRCCNPPILSYQQNDQDIPAGTYFSNPKGPLGLEMGGKDFMRIEGHMGGTHQEAMNRIQALKQLHNLDFDTKVLMLGDPILTESQAINQQIGDLLESMEQLWAKALVGARNGSPLGQDQLQQLVNFRDNMIALTSSWQTLQAGRNGYCDIGNLQSDYLQLRSSIMCETKKLLPLLGSFPEVIAGASQAFCLEFNDFPSQIRFGNGNNSPGDVIYTEANVPVSVENFFFNAAGESFFGFAMFTTDNSGNRAINLGNVNFRFDFSNLGFQVDEVSFEIGDFGGFENIGANGSITVGEIQNNFGGQTVAPGIDFSFNQQTGTRGTATLRGNMSEAIIGGQEFFLYRVCISGTSQLTGEVASLELDVLNTRMRSLAVMLEEVLPKEVTEANFQAISGLYEDLVNTVIQVKLLYGLLLPAQGGMLQAYSDFPRWDDLLFCLNKIHYSCLLPKIIQLFYTLQYLRDNHNSLLLNQLTGLEHKAGVMKDGTFLLVCEEGEGGDTQVIADFCVEGNSCCCEIDQADICFPPVALPKYVVMSQMPDSEVLVASIGLTEQGMNLNGNIPLRFGLENPVSALGANLTLNEESGTVGYSISAVSNVIDHFTYQLIDEECELERTGHVWILIKGATESLSAGGPTPPLGELPLVGLAFKGSVRDANERGISGATISIFKEDFQAETGIGGSFSVILANPGVYEMVISHPNFITRAISFQVEQGGDGALPVIILRANSISNTFINRVSAALNLDVEEAQREIETIFTPRRESREIAINELRNDPVITASPTRKALLKMEAFAPEVVADDPQRANASFEKAIQEISSDFSQATTAEKKSLRKLAEQVVHTYLETVVMIEGERLSEERALTITKGAKMLERAEISVKGIRDRWKANELSKKLKLEIAEDIRKAFQ